MHKEVSFWHETPKPANPTPYGKTQKDRNIREERVELLTNTDPEIYRCRALIVWYHKREKKKKKIAKKRNEKNSSASVCSRKTTDAMIHRIGRQTKT
jgi:hypothetical protein